jgi:hypothetical protein
MSADLSRRAAEALAKLLAAGCIKSAWLPGMAGFRDDIGKRRRVVETDRRGITRWCDEVGDYAEGDGWNREEIAEEWAPVAPDLSDALTVQGLVLLAREAWGDPLLHVSPSSQWKVGAHVWIAWTYSDAEKVSCWREVARSATEAEAAVTALEAAAEVTRG